MRRTLQQRFMAKVNMCPMSGCWLWSGTHASSGKYGSVNVGGKMRGAHVVSYEIHNGRVPAGLRVLHRCDVGMCVNPSHLFIGTAKDNTADMIAKGRFRPGKPVLIRDTSSGRFLPHNGVHHG